MLPELTRDPSFRIAVLVCALLALITCDRCRPEPTPATTRAAAPSELVSRDVDDAGVETSTYTVLLDHQTGAIERLTDRVSRLAKDSTERRLLAAELKRAKHVRAATVLTTATPCGDTIRQSVTLREEAAPGPLGFLKPRQTVVDVRQLTDSARTLAVQSWALPPAAPKAWAVGVGVGYGVGPDGKLRPTLGIHFTRTLIRF